MILYENYSRGLTLNGLHPMVVAVAPPQHRSRRDYRVGKGSHWILREVHDEVSMPFVAALSEEA